MKRFLPATVSAGLLTLGAMVTGIIPTLAAWAFLGIGTLALWIGTGSITFAATLAKSHDDPNERLAWALTGIVALGVILAVIVVSWNDWSLLTKFFAVAAPLALVVVALGAKK